MVCYFFSLSVSLHILHLVLESRVHLVRDSEEGDQSS
jgi:hypothetical protein